MRQQAAGFTLLEMLVVLVMAVLLVTVTPAVFSGMSSTAELRSAVRQLAAGLRQARNIAISRQQEAVLRLDLERRRFTVSGDPREIALPSALHLHLYTAQSELFGGQSGQVRFFPDGSSTGGAITVRGAKLAYRITIDWLTGAVAIAEQERVP